GAVSGSPRGDLGHNAGQSMQTVGARDNADKLVSVDDRNALDVATLHRAHDVIEGCFGAHRVHIMCHDVTDAAAARTGVLISEPTRSDEVFDPSRSPPLGADLASAQEITLGDDAGELPRAVDHRQTTDFVLQHEMCRRRDRRIGSYRKDGWGHDILCFHGRTPFQDLPSPALVAVTMPATRIPDRVCYPGN